MSASLFPSRLLASCSATYWPANRLPRQIFPRRHVMQVLISPVCYEEAASILDTEVDIIDIKNFNEGSLGAQFPWHTRKVVELTSARGIKTSATLGDLPYKPGTA